MGTCGQKKRLIEGDMIDIGITWPYRLRRGHSDDPAKGACAMDALNWLVHGRHGDAPECACPVVASYVIKGNDTMPDDVRQRLLVYLPRIAGSRSAEHEAIRVRVFVLAAARVFAPIALDAAGLHDHAARLRALPDDADYKTIYAASASYAADAASDAATRAARAAAHAAASRAAANAYDAAAHAAAQAAAYATRAAANAYDAAALWQPYFAVLDAALNAGPQGEPWSADVVARGTAAYVAAGGAEVTVYGDPAPTP